MSQTIVVQYGSRNATLLQGWKSQPNSRGTMDIIWSCAFTIFLSSWSVLCLNLPARNDGWWKRARRKLYWMLLTIMGPEIVFQLALGEWLLARKNKKAFQDAGYESWSMTHSFYANMGGFILSSPDHGRFPVNAAQLYFLLDRGHIDYPTIERDVILDRNKAEAMVRVLTAGQIIWFIVSSIARVQQGKALTSIELSTLAFTLSAMGSFFCWFHKPMDIETPDTLILAIPVEQIRYVEGEQDKPWLQTPLDFVDRRREWPWNIYWQCGLTWMRRAAGLTGLSWFVLGNQEKPIERVADDYWPQPTFRSLPALFVFHAGYAAILVAGWNLDLPTYVELLWWRITTMIQLGTIVSGWVTMPLMMQDAPRGLQVALSYLPGMNRSSPSTSRKWYGKHPVLTRAVDHLERTRSLVNDDENWRASVRLLIVYQLTWLVYFLSRLYIIFEDLVSLRALPLSAFQEVDWSQYFPHI